MCKMLFCAKTIKRRQTKQQGKSKDWNFVCITLKFWLHYLAYAGFSICILSIHIKTENVQNAFLCQKQTQADKATRQMQALKFWLQLPCYALLFEGMHSNKTKKGTICKTRVCDKNNKTYSKNLHKKRRLIPSFLHFT